MNLLRTIDRLENKLNHHTHQTKYHKERADWYHKELTYHRNLYHQKYDKTR